MESELNSVIETFVSLICYMNIFSLILLFRLLLERNNNGLPHFFGLIEGLIALYIWSQVKPYFFEL